MEVLRGGWAHIQVDTHRGSLLVLCGWQVFQLQILVTFWTRPSCRGCWMVKVLPVPSSQVSFPRSAFPTLGTVGKTGPSPGTQE